jgi:hypothetical protein
MVNLYGLLKSDEGIVYWQGGSHQKQTKWDSQFLFTGTDFLVGRFAEVTSTRMAYHFAWKRDIKRGMWKYSPLREACNLDKETVKFASGTYDHHTTVLATNRRPCFTNLSHLWNVVTPARIRIEERKQRKPTSEPFTVRSIEGLERQCFHMNKAPNVTSKGLHRMSRYSCLYDSSWYGPLLLEWGFHIWIGTQSTYPLWLPMKLRSWHGKPPTMRSTCSGMLSFMTSETLPKWMTSGKRAFTTALANGSCISRMWVREKAKWKRLMV